MGSIAYMAPTLQRPTRYPHGLCDECRQPAVDHYDTSGVILLGCPNPLAVEHSDENITKALTILIDLFGPMGVQNLFDYIDLSGTDPLRARLAKLAGGLR